MIKRREVVPECELDPRDAVNLLGRGVLVATPSLFYSCTFDIVSNAPVASPSSLLPQLLSSRSIFIPIVEERNAVLHTRRFLNALECDYS